MNSYELKKIMKGNGKKELSITILKKIFYCNNNQFLDSPLFAPPSY